MDGHAGGRSAPWSGLDGDRPGIEIRRVPPAQTPDLVPETERLLAVGLYNDVWRLIELPDRTPEQDDEMLHQAHASRHHWSRVGKPVNLARGEWLCSRVYSVLGRPEPALHHARRCLEILLAIGGGEDWDLAGAYEALARAHRAADDDEEARRWLAEARKALGSIANQLDRRHIEANLDTLGLD
jgi:hypothetical protein